MKKIVVFFSISLLLSNFTMAQELTDYSYLIKGNLTDLMMGRVIIEVEFPYKKDLGLIAHLGIQNEGILL